MLLLDHILGIAIVMLAYGALWYFVLQSRRTIEKIDKGGLENLREIKQELQVKGREAWVKKTAR